MICDKCGSIAEYSSYYGRVICTNSKCTWESSKMSNHELKTTIENAKTSKTIKHYIIKFVSQNIEIYQAPSVYSLIQKLLAEEGNFSPVVAKCYTAFSDSDTHELVSFYNRFGEYEIDLISEAEKFRELYKR